MRTFHTGLQTFIAAIRARDKVALRTREEINHQTDQPRKEDKKHPENGGVHAARLGVPCDPNQKRDIQDDQGDQKNAAAAADSTSGSRIAIPICPTADRSKEYKQKGWNPCQPAMRHLSYLQCNISDPAQKFSIAPLCPGRMQRSSEGHRCLLPSDRALNSR